MAMDYLTKFQWEKYSINYGLVLKMFFSDWDLQGGWIIRKIQKILLINLKSEAAILPLHQEFKNQRIKQ